ncbi:hypothetical protein FDP41_006911 [Naegleria fowleri]|uniref:Uncharacterized protein n=1 Tax=Naegleria fowleri TaxID=5763 RepID=A0A6A5BIN2_NAEFO|nr:uncharacterized protein FDP41_006911 [Naegleria fowleri]KAF0974301.1 hypothetical protein FDP41_006911 [Naegleria fowleri]
MKKLLQAPKSFFLNSTSSRVCNGQSITQFNESLVPSSSLLSRLKSSVSVQRNFHSDQICNAPTIKPINENEFYKFSRDFAIASAKASQQIDSIFRVPNKQNDAKKENAIRSYSQMMLGLYLFHWLSTGGDKLKEPSMAKAISMLDQVSQLQSGTEQNIREREEMAREFANAFSSNDAEIERLKKQSVDERQNILRAGSLLVAYPFLKGQFTRDFIQEANNANNPQIIQASDFELKINPQNIGESFKEATEKVKKLSEFFMNDTFKKAQQASSATDSLLQENNRDAIYHYNYLLLTILYQKHILAQMTKLKKKDLASMNSDDITAFIEGASAAEYAIAIAGNPYDKLLMAAVSNLHIHAV